MENEGPKSNVVIFPQMVSLGKRELLEPEGSDITVEEAKQKAIDKINEMGDTSESIFAMCLDKETGVPTIIMGGFTDPSYVNMFIDLVKDELKELFRNSHMHYHPDDGDDSGV